MARGALETRVSGLDIRVQGFVCLLFGEMGGEEDLEVFIEREILVLSQKTLAEIVLREGIGVSSAALVQLLEGKLVADLAAVELQVVGEIEIVFGQLDVANRVFDSLLNLLQFNGYLLLVVLSLLQELLLALLQNQDLYQVVLLRLMEDPGKELCLCMPALDEVRVGQRDLDHLLYLLLLLLEVGLYVPLDFVLLFPELLDGFLDKFPNLSGEKALFFLYLFVQKSTNEFPGRALYLLADPLQYLIQLGLVFLEGTHEVLLIEHLVRMMPSPNEAVSTNEVFASRAIDVT